jgi:hypothetical protein
VSSPAFAQPERRSFLLPILLALAAIAVAAAVAVHFFPATTINIAHLRTDAVPTETVFKGSTVVGQVNVDRELFIASNIRIDNQLSAPIYLDDFHLALTVTNPDGRDAQLTAQAFSKNELSDAQVNYPVLKPLLTTPLLREAAIEPGKSAQGTILFALKVPKTMWDQRKSAIVKVDVYHHNPLYLTIP